MGGLGSGSYALTPDRAWLFVMSVGAQGTNSTDGQHYGFTKLGYLSIDWGKWIGIDGLVL